MLNPYEKAVLQVMGWTWTVLGLWVLVSFAKGVWDGVVGDDLALGKE